jgi:signal transduction protein with GAF and PtsI domain
MNNAAAPGREVAALTAIVQAVSGGQSQAEVLSALLAATVTAMGYKAATLRLLDEERQQLALQAAYGLSDTYLGKGAVEVAQSELDQQVLQGQWVELAEVRAAPGFQYPEAAAREGLASGLVIPLLVREKAIGVLRVYTGEPHSFSAAERGVLAAAASLGAGAIQRARLFEAFQRIAYHVSSSLEIKRVLATLLVEAVREVNVKAASLRLLGPRRMTLHLAAAYGLSDAYLQKGQVTVANSPVDQQVLTGGAPVCLGDVSEAGALQYPDEAAREGLRSVMVLPLQVHGTAIGVLRLYSAQSRRFSPEDQSFAAAVADLGALAIENAKLHAQLQQRLETLKEDADGWYRFLTRS